MDNSRTETDFLNPEITPGNVSHNSTNSSLFRESLPNQVVLSDDQEVDESVFEDQEVDESFFDAESKNASYNSKSPSRATSAGSDEVNDALLSNGKLSFNQSKDSHHNASYNQQSPEQNPSSSGQLNTQNISNSESIFSDFVVDPIDPLTAALESDSLSDSIVAAIQLMESNKLNVSDDHLSHANIMTSAGRSQRRRVRRICSDSDDEEIVTSPDKNSSYRQPKINFDSDEESEEERRDNTPEKNVGYVEEEVEEDSDHENVELEEIHQHVEGEEEENHKFNHDHENNHHNHGSHKHDNHKSCEHHKHKKDRSVVDDDSLNASGNNDSDVVAVSSEDEDEIRPLREINRKPRSKKTVQPKLDSMLQNMSLVEPKKEVGDHYHCSPAEYSNQATKVSSLRTEALKCKNLLRTLNLNSLPDKGMLLQQRQRNLVTLLSKEEEQLKRMIVTADDQQTKKPVSWEQLVENSNCVVPKTMGKAAVNTHTVAKTLTMDRLKRLHDSLATCPDENTYAEDPRGLKVELMPHQRRALAWLQWREGQKPPGGILADDMGLGKTLSMISLILFTKDMDVKENSSDSEVENAENVWHSRKSNKCADGGTLIVCPATLIRQWEAEVSNRVKRGLLTCEVYHGTNRESSSRRLAKYDMVVTTYKLVQGEHEKKGPLFGIKWKRIILDEAHVIRNSKAQTSVAACALKAKTRWALTGTPVHNKELDLYALLKFLRCSPFDDIAIWKHWVANKDAGGQDRLNTVIKSILLRRTKAQLQSEGGLEALPEKKFEEIMVELDASEKQVYQKVLIFSRTMFIEFLRQRAQKNPEFAYAQGNLKETNDEQYNKMHQKVLKAHGGADIKSHQILVLLLRLRQICCHPSLINKMLDKDNCDAEGIEEDGLEVDFFYKFDQMKLDDDDNDNEPAANKNETGATDLASAANKILSSSNPVFASDRPNEKLRLIQKIIEEKVIVKGDKIIIVSQWTSMLDIIYQHLRTAKIKCDMLDGKVPVHKRNDIVVNFNNPNHRVQVLLLSLTAGGVGLNLVGANHLLLVDLHWNPQLESQAQDRIYRVGQKKPVFIYKIITTDTIEERIKALQDAKLQMAGDILSGARAGAGSKLSMDDLKMLFNIGAE